MDTGCHSSKQCLHIKGQFFPQFAISFYKKIQEKLNKKVRRRRRTWQQQKNEVSRFQGTDPREVETHTYFPPLATLFKISL